MNRKILVIFTFLMFVVMPGATGCKRYQDISVTSVKLDSFALRGLRSADVTLEVGVDNPAGKIEISEFSGDLSYFGKVLGKVTVDPFVLRPRDEGFYDVKVHLSLLSGVTVSALLDVLDVRNLKSLTKMKDVKVLVEDIIKEELLVDMNVEGKAGIMRIKQNYKDVSLKHLMKKLLKK